MDEGYTTKIPLYAQNRPSPKGNNAIIQMKQGAWLAQEEGIQCPLTKHKRNIIILIKIWWEKIFLAYTQKKTYLMIFNNIRSLGELPR